MAEPMSDPHREFVQGLIQIAVGYYHLQRDNVKGARKLLSRGFGRINNFPLVAYPLEISAFRSIVKATLDLLESLPDLGPTDLIEPHSELTLRYLRVKEKVQFPKIAHK